MKVWSKIPIDQLTAIVKHKKINECILHSESWFDSWFESELVEEFLSILKLWFANLNQIETLRIYQVDDEMVFYFTNKNDR